MRPEVEEVIKGGTSQGLEKPPKKFAFYPQVNGGSL